MTYITVPDDEVPKKPAPNMKYSQTPYVGATVDSRQKNISTISSYISGSRWVVDIYRQILGRDDAASTHSDDSLSVHKQYTLIRGVPIIVSSDLQESQNSDGQRSFEMVGSGSIIYDITPTEGDVIIADVGDGREAEFTITSTERVSIYPEAYVDVSYRAVRIIDAAIRKEFDDRVKETLYYSVDNQRSGLKALLTQDEAHTQMDLRRLYDVLVRRYIRDFSSTSYVSLVIPDQETLSYDPYLTRFFKAVVNASQYPEMHDINLLNMNGDDLTDEETFWDAILHVDFTTLGLLPTKAGFVSVNQFRSRPLFNSVYFSGFQTVLRMTNPTYSVNQYDPSGPFRPGLNKGGHHSEYLKDIIPIQDLSENPPEYMDYNNDPLPMIIPIIGNPYYVLSQSFYEKKIPTSILERLLLNRVEKATLDNRLLAKLAENSLYFDNLDRFYYTPIILALIRLSDGVL